MPRASAQPKRVPGKTTQPAARRQDGQHSKRQKTVQQSQYSDVSYGPYGEAIDHDVAMSEPDIPSVSSDSEPEMVGNATYRPAGGSRKRKRGHNHERNDEPPTMSAEQQAHIVWSDELLDYFMLQTSDAPPEPAPSPPAYIDLNAPIDEKGNTPIHWAAAMGDMAVVQDLVSRGAATDVLTNSGETPLMRAVTFTNNWTRRTMPKLVSLLYPTSGQRDCFGSTVFHHIAVSTCSKSKYPCARYYLDAILVRLTENYPLQQIGEVLDQQDHNGDTAILLAAKFGARKCVRALTTHGASVELRNQKGETADQYIKELNARRRDRARGNSSSPPPAGPNAAMDGVSFDAATSDQPPGSSQNAKAELAATSQSRAAATAHYNSSAAALVSSQLPTLISMRAANLAAALEAELAEREEDAQEGERLLKRRKVELAGAKEHGDGVASKVSLVEEEEGEGEPRRELDNLVVECGGLVSERAGSELSAWLKKMRTAEATESGDAFVDRGGAAGHVADLQSSRSALVTDIVGAMGLSSPPAHHSKRSRVGGERKEAYKRLIMSALNVESEEQLRTVIPEILADLEDGGDGGLGGLGGVVADSFALGAGGGVAAGEVGRDVGMKENVVAAAANGGAGGAVKVMG